ncbi:MAG TPA: hypothetical protein VH092_17720 [Urbifossiella sp.]|nr:hypothetical protein [Urbifossiella sp.]
MSAATGCSNAPIAGTLDAIWPASGGAKDGKDNGSRPPIVPDVRPPDPRAPLPGPAPTDALPPPADVLPSADPKL